MAAGPRPLPPHPPNAGHAAEFAKALSKQLHLCCNSTVFHRCAGMLP